jgi:hypothetical protein
MARSSLEQLMKGKTEKKKRVVQRLKHCQTKGKGREEEEYI